MKALNHFAHHLKKNIVKEGSYFPPPKTPRLDHSFFFFSVLHALFNTLRN